MKTYNIFISIAVIITLLIFTIPQLTGTIFVNNQKDQIPSDWLSALVLDNEKKPKLNSYVIPRHTKAIKIIGNNKYTTISSGLIEINNSKDKQIVSFYDYNDINFSTKDDTLIIKNMGKYNPTLTIEINSNTKKIIIDNLVYGIIKPTQTATFDLKIENNSNIILESNYNPNIKNIVIEGQSTLELKNCFIIPKINIEVNNSMVYVDPQNNIDSLKVNLIGKSNIKKSITTNSLTTNSSDKIKEELGIKNTKINIYPTGDLQYYNLNPF